MPQPATLPELIGQTLGDYTILRRLGKGGMAEVFLARQNSLERQVALKILKPELALDESYVKRFHREAKSAAALVQANIVQIFEVGQIQGLHFIAQEYVPGRNLKQHIDRYGAIEPVMAMNLLFQCTAALQKASEFNVVHRDIKPENILLSPQGDIKITDFGLARINNDASRQALTQIGITMGTPLYMSPEQVEGGSLDSRSDIYALGLTAYHALAGQPAFDGENALAIAFKQVKHNATPLQQIRPDVPLELCQLIHKMIAKAPQDRPENPASLLRELRRIKFESLDDWDSIIEKLAVRDTMPISNGPTLSQTRLAATRQLQNLMKGQVRAWWLNPRWLAMLSAVSLLALVGGFWLAVSTRPQFPLDVESSLLDQVPKQPKVEQQFFSASLASSTAIDKQRKVEMWKSVIDYFPIEESNAPETTRLYHYRALVRLGEIYLVDGELENALKIFDELEKSGEFYKQYQACGYAGKLIVYSRSEELAGGLANQSALINKYLELLGNQFSLLNSFFRQEVEKIRIGD
jgi:eukaryotic-like serine/threonine-protein kinase